MWVISLGYKGAKGVRFNYMPEKEARSATGQKMKLGVSYNGEKRVSDSYISGKKIYGKQQCKKGASW